MTKQWKKSLEQSDILSDGTPFDGSKIDQKISEAGGGTDFSSLTYQFIDTAPADVTGSGFIFSIEYTNENTSSDDLVEFDDITLFNGTLDGETYTISTVISFDSSFFVGSSSDEYFNENVGVLYALD